MMPTWHGRRPKVLSARARACVCVSVCACASVFANAYAWVESRNCDEHRARELRAHTVGCQGRQRSSIANHRRWCEASSSPDTLVSHSRANGRKKEKGIVEAKFQKRVGVHYRPVFTLHTHMTDNKQVSAPSTDEATTNSSSLGASVSEATADHADPRDGVVDSAAVDGSAGDTAAPASSRGVTVAVEAFGSGVVLHAGLSVPLDKTVADLRQLVLSARGSANARMVRLFIGHGGTELDNGALTLADSPLADDCDQPLVVLAVPCTYPLRHRHSKLHFGG